MEALKIDPDNIECQRAIKSIKKATDLKDEATNLFKSNNLEGAL